MNRLRGQFIAQICLTIMVALTFYPFVQMLVLSGKSWSQFEHRPWRLTFPFYWENFTHAWDALAYPLGNSLLIVSVSTVGILALSSLTAFVFARFDFHGKRILFYAILCLMMVPGILSLIPQFMLVKRLGLMGTRWALILPYVAGGQVFGIFLLRSFFQSIPPVCSKRLK